MTVVTTGASLGLFNSSANVLGAAGMLGQGWLGQALQRSYVNAVTGNLVLQAQDEQLSGRGADLFQLRTYNSLGQLNDGDGDGWRWDGERSVVFAAGTNKEGPGVGGSVTRTGSDGHVTTYTWDGSKYVSTDGDGAHDTVRYEASTPDGAQWVWTDGTTRLEERYSAGTGLLASQKDTSGNLIEYGYTDGRLATITDHGSGQQIELVYAQVPNTSLTRLSQVNTRELVVDDSGHASLSDPIKQVEYNYDSKGRLTQVKTDLTPEDSTDNLVYITTYGYDGDSSRIASISQSDGTNATFTYEQAANNGPWRVKTVTDAAGTQTFTYDDANRSTDIAYDAGNGATNVWTYVYDAKDQLTQIKSPDRGADGSRLVTTFEYETNADDGAGHEGNLKSVVDARGNAVTYKYDPFGNRILERDAEGDTIQRTFNSANQLETETRFTDKDPDGDGAAQPAGALTTRFVYDDLTHTQLRFVISAEGRVSESRYGTGINDAGLLTRTLHFTASYFNVDALAQTEVPSEADLTSWVNNTADKTQVERTDIEYDLRGNVSRRIDYAAADANSAGVLDKDPAATVTEYISDAHGLLRQTIAVRGKNRDQRTILTSFDFDGMGRETKRVTAGATQTTDYNGTARTVTTMNEATGLMEARTFDDKGRLVSVADSGNATGEQDGPTITRQTLYLYDLSGRLRMTQDTQGNRHFNFYDDAGQLKQTVDSTGAVCNYDYNDNGQLIAQTHFSDPVPLAAMKDWVSADGIVQKTTLVAGTDFKLTPLQDRTAKFLYDKSGRLTQRIDAANIVTTTTYDGASRVRLQQTADRITRYLHDRDGNQTGVVDPLGHLTEIRFDAGNRPVETIRYTQRSTAAIDESAPVWVGVQNQTVTAYQTFSYRLPAIDADGDALEFSIVGQKPDWLNFDKDTATLSGVPTIVPREFTVTVRADDKRGKVSDVPVTFTVVESAPLWAQLPDVTVPLNTQGYVLELPHADNPQHTPLTYSVVNPQLLPEGLSFSVLNDVPRITGTPTKAGSAVITLQVSDGVLVTQRSFTLAVISRGPMWLLDSRTTPVPEGFINTPYSFQVPAATDPDGQALTYLPLELPPGLSFDPVTRVITGTPTVLNDSQLVRLQARDPDGNVTELRFGINVRQPNKPPEWDTTTFDLTSSIGLFFDFSAGVHASDPEQKALTFSAVGLPAGLTINSATGRISGIPIVASIPVTLPVTITARDSGDLTATATLNLTIENRAPVGKNIPLETAESSNKEIRWDGFDVTGFFSDFEGQTLSYSADMSTAFSWMTFDAGVFGGNIPAHFKGSCHVIVTATDPYNATGTTSFKLTVSDGTFLVGDATEARVDAAPDGTPPAVGDTDAAAAIAALPQITINVPPDVTVPEGDRGTIFTADSNLDVVWSLSGSDAGLFNINSNSGAVSYRGDFVPDFDGQREYTFTVNAIEAEPEEGGKKQRASQAVALHVVNQPPVISGVPDRIAFNEGTPTTSVLFTASTFDPGGGTPTLELENDGDASSFSMDLAGQVRFNAVPDFETKNVYTLIFRSVDATGLDTLKRVTIDINNLPPTISGMPASPIEVDEGFDPNTKLFSVSALDAGGGAVTLTLEGADADAFRIVDGEVRFRETPNYETKHSYTFSVRAADTVGASSEQSVSINVRNIPPTLSGVPTAPIVVDEGFNATLFTAAISDVAGGPVTLSLIGTDAAAFEVGADGQVRFATVPDFEAQHSFTFTVRSSDGFAFVDQPVTVNVKDRPPAIFGGATASVPEGTPTAQWVYYARATDGGGNLSYVLDGPDAADFTIDSLGLVYLKKVPNYETKTSYSFTVHASDGTTPVMQPVTLSITNIAPTIAGPDNVDVQEESAGVIFAPVANDAGGGPISFMLEGSDADVFMIDPATGEVRLPRDARLRDAEPHSRSRSGSAMARCPR